MDHAGIDRRPKLVASIERWNRPSAWPKRIRDYQLIEPIGVGGMGVVLRAVHRRLKKPVAVKLIRSTHVGGDEAIARFVKETEAVGQLSHPNIIAALDAGEHDGLHYLVMELVDGQDAAKRIRQIGPMSCEEAADVIRQAALGLKAAHDAGFVHRDIKPSNIMIGEDGHVRVMDFGLAGLSQTSLGSAGRLHPRDSLTKTGQEVGTPLYMSPEQRAGEIVDAASDVYSLGLTFHYLLTATAAPQDAISYAGLPPRLAELLADLLASDPARRPNMGQVAQRLEGYLSQAAAQRQKVKWWRSRPTILFAVAAILAVTIGALRSRERVDTGPDRSTSRERRALRPNEASRANPELPIKLPIKLVHDPAATDLKRLTLVNQHDAPLLELALAQEGKQLCSLHQDGVITVESFPDQRGCTFYYHLESLVAADCSRKTSSIIALDENGQILYLKSPQPGAANHDRISIIDVGQFKDYGAPTCLRFAADEMNAFVGFASGVIAKISLQEEVLTNWKCRLPEPVQRLIVSDKILVASGPQTTWILEASPGARKRALDIQPLDLDIALDGSRILLAQSSGEVSVYDAGSGKAISRWSLDLAPARRVRFLTDERYVAVGTRQGELLLHDATSGALLFRHAVADRSIDAMAVTRDGGHIVSGAAKWKQVTQLPMQTNCLPGGARGLRQKWQTLDSVDLTAPPAPRLFFVRPPPTSIVTPHYYAVNAAGQSGETPCVFVFVAKDQQQLQRRRPDLDIASARNGIEIREFGNIHQVHQAFDE